MAVELHSQIESLYLIGTKPYIESYDSIQYLDQDSFPGRWKILNFYENDFNRRTETEFYEWHSLTEHFDDADAVVLWISNDSIECKLGWKENNVQLKEFSQWLCADPGIDTEPPMAHQLGAFNFSKGKNHRATFIVDPDNIIQHISISSSETNRSPHEALRIIESLQAGGSNEGEMPDGTPLTAFDADDAIADMT